MDSSNNSKPRVCFEFQVEKILGISNEGNYQVQWTPAWVSPYHLLGCEHLIQEFLQKQLKTEVSGENHVTEGDQRSEMENSYFHPNSEIPEPDSSCPSLSREPRKVDATIDSAALCNESYDLVENSTGGYVENSTKPMSIFGDLSIFPRELENKIPFNTLPVTDLKIESSIRNETVVCWGESEPSARDLDLLSDMSDQTQQPEIFALSVCTDGTVDSYSPQVSPTYHFDKYPIVTTTKINCQINEENNDSSPGDTSSDMKNVRRSSKRSKKPYNRSATSNYVKSWQQSSQKKERRYDCLRCGKSFLKLYHLNQHILLNSHHLQLSCSYCTKIFNNKSKLDAHLRKHTGKKPHLCPTCGKSFALKSNLKRHMQVHTGVRPFGCEVCCKTFSQKETRDRHMTIHTGEKKFACGICGNTFTRKDHQNEHTLKCSLTLTQQEGSQ